MTADPEAEYWTIEDVAAYWQVKPKTIREYRVRAGAMPSPDDTFGRSPVWRPATIIAFERPGQGARTDLAGRPRSNSETASHRPKSIRPASHAPIVYYLSFGDRIKIGTTTNLGLRLKVIPHDELLVTEPGDVALERERHRQFAHLRAKGEWFHASPELLLHIENLQLRHATG